MLSEGLEARSVVVRRGGQAVVDHLSLQARPGQILGIMGANGAGKSSLFSYLAGLMPGEGAVFLNGKRLNGLPLHKRSRLGLAYVPQGPSVFPALTVRQNLQSVADLRLKKPAREPAIEGALTRFDLAGRAGIRAGQLSGGERRRLELARALLPDPSCLILDEPFAALDPRSVFALQRLLGALAGDGLAIVIADHRVEAAMACISSGLVLHRGLTVATGDPASLRRSVEATRLYFGSHIVSDP